jgi:hypothetical protein
MGAFKARIGDAIGNPISHVRTLELIAIAQVIGEQEPRPGLQRRRGDVPIGCGGRQALGDSACVGMGAISGSIGAMTCRPLPPVVFGQQSSPSAASSSRSRKVVPTTNPHSRPSPGSRSKTSVSGCSISSTVAPRGEFRPRRFRPIPRAGQVFDPKPRASATLPFHEPQLLHRYGNVRSGPM